MEEKRKIVIDVCSMYGLQLGVEKLALAEIVDIFRKTGILIYNGREGNEPKIYDDVDSVCIDVANLNKKQLTEIEEIINQFKN